MVKFEEKYYNIFAFIADLMILNVMFIISLIPIVTIGGSLLALFKSVQQVFFEKKGSTTRIYLREFKKQTLKGFKLTGLLITLVFIFKLNFSFFDKAKYVEINLIICFMIGCLIIFILLLPYVLVYIANQDEINMSCVEKATIACFNKPLLSLFLLLLNVLSMTLLLVSIEMFTIIAMLYFFFGFSLTIYLNNYFIDRFSFKLST